MNLMHIQIDNGYRLAARPMSEVMEWLHPLHLQLREKAHRRLHRVLARRLALLLDQYDFNGANRPKHLIPEVWSSHLDKLASSRGDNQYQPEDDFEVKWVFYPGSENILCRLFTAQQEFEEDWKRFPGVEAFNFTDTEERPAGISMTDWRRRGGVWRKILDDNNPSHLGLTVFLFDDSGGPQLNHRLLQDSMPSKEERVKALAQRVLFKKRLKLSQPPAHISIWIPDYFAWLETAEGSRQLENSIKKIEPRLTPRLNLNGETE